MTFVNSNFRRSSLHFTISCEFIKKVVEEANEIFQKIDLDKHVSSCILALCWCKAEYKKNLNICIPHKLRMKISRISIYESLLKRNTESNNFQSESYTEIDEVSANDDGDSYSLTLHKTLFFSFGGFRRESYVVGYPKVPRHSTLISAVIN